MSTIFVSMENGAVPIRTPSRAIVDWNETFDLTIFAVDHVVLLDRLPSALTTLRLENGLSSASN